MLNIEFLKDKIYKGVLNKNGKKYIVFFESKNDTLYNVITNDIFKLEDLIFFEHYDINPFIIKFFTKRYKRENDFEVFFLTPNIENGNISSYIKTLRFFDLDSEDLFQTKIETKILDKVVSKMEKYLKRYIEKEDLALYIRGFKSAENLMEILSFIPNDEKFQKIFFWHTEISKNDLYIRFFYHLKTLGQFQISFKNLQESESNRDTLDRAIYNWVEFFKDKASKEDLEVYSTQLKKFKRVMEIICFLPPDIKDVENIPFWHFEIENFRTIIRNFYFHAFTKNAIKLCNHYDINIMDIIEEESLAKGIFNISNHYEFDKILEIFNEFGFSLKELLLDKNILINKLDEIEKEPHIKYRKDCEKILNEKIKEAKNTLDSELQFANKNDDEELILEINLIQEEINKLESNILEFVKTIDIEKPPLDWWPSLLYPLPEIPLQNYKMEYFRKRDLVNNIKGFLYD